MLSPVSERTRRRLERLTRTETVAGVEITYCPCRVLPETVLNLRTLMREIHLLWRATLGDESMDRLEADPAGSTFLAGEVRLTSIQEGRPDMVGVWLPVPPDYPERLKVQLIDSVEPFEFP